MKAEAKLLESYSYISLTSGRKHCPIRCLIFYEGVISFCDFEPIHTTAALVLELGSISQRRWSYYLYYFISFTKHLNG